MRLRNLSIIAVLFLVMGIPCLHAESIVSRENVIKAATLYNIFKFIDWPSASFENNGSPLLLVVIGDDLSGRALTSIDGKLVKGHPINVVYTNETIPDGPCHAVFVTQAQTANATLILRQLKGRPILTVADHQDFTSKGGMINFFIEDNKVRFEINAAEAAAVNLKISSKLMTLGKIVTTEATGDPQ